MKDTQASWRRISRKTLTTKYIPLCAQQTRSYVLKQLYEKHPCLIIDEMKKNGNSYYNLLLSSLMTRADGSNYVEVYYLDCLRLQSDNAESIGTAIGSTVKALADKKVYVNCYASDNCAVMIKAAEIACKVAGTTITRVPCASHALNNVFKTFMNQPQIHSIWCMVIYMRSK